MLKPPTSKRPVYVLKLNIFKAYLLPRNNIEIDKSERERTALSLYNLTFVKRYEEEGELTS
jgi:hypothetical protein